MTDPCEVCAVLNDEIWNCDTCFFCRFNENLYDPGYSFEDPDLPYVGELYDFEEEL